MSKRPDGVTVTLCMIVKDEEHIIHECLNSMGDRTLIDTISPIQVQQIEPKKLLKSGVRRTTSPELFMMLLGVDLVSLEQSHQKR